MASEKRRPGRPKDPEEVKQAKEVQQYPVRMPKATHKNLKLVCEALDIEMNDAVNTAIREWLERQGEVLKKSEALVKAGAAAKAD